MFSEFYDDDTMKVLKVGDAFDLAYICVILAAIGKAIPNIEKEEDGIYFLKRGRIRYVDGNDERGRGSCSRSE